MADRRTGRKRTGKTSARKAKPAPKRSWTERRRRAARPRGSRLANLLLFPFVLIWRFALSLAVVTALILGGTVAYLATTLPPVETLLDARARGSVTMLDREGQVFAWRGETFGGQITPDTVSPNLKNAVVATEDRRFYMHPGVDPIGIAGAIRINMAEGRGPLTGHGGSTITQQTAKLLCLGDPYDPESGMTEAEFEADCRRTTLWRKVKEAVYALALEARYTKDEVLTIYLNRVYLGAGARGFEAASQRYFGHSAANVSPAEGAMLAGLLVAPSTYAPTANLRRSQERANVIIGLMENQGYLSEAEAAQARAEPAQLSEAAAKRAGGYFADWIMEEGPSFLTSETTEDVVIETTLDQSIQDAAEEAIETVFAEKLSEGSEAQAAVVVMSADGAVRAMVGGRKFKGVAGQFNRAVQAKRQTGSAFKPFVYAAALELGYTFDDRVYDGPLTLQIPGSGPWSPKNYTGQFYGDVTLTTALQHSMNTAAVRVSESVGREAVRAVAEGFGVESSLDQGPALALGTSEASLLEMTGAYAGILNGGSAVEPYGIEELRLKGEDQPIIGQEGGIGERVISQDAAAQLTYMMSTVVGGGTGTRARLDGRPAAGKTGTTNSARDAWFIGFTADYVAGVWMGYDDNTPLRGTTGGGLPAEIWREAMARIHADVPPRALPQIDPRIARARQTPIERTPGDGTVAQSTPPAQTPRQDPTQGDALQAAERVINNVLGAIFGR